MVMEYANHYATLGVTIGASAEAVKTAYKRCALEFHPDRNRNANAKTQFQRVAEAWLVLGDPVKKAHFDRARAASAHAAQCSAAAHKADVTRTPVRRAHQSQPAAMDSSDEEGWMSSDDEWHTPLGRAPPQKPSSSSKYEDDSDGDEPLIKSACATPLGSCRSSGGIQERRFCSSPNEQVSNDAQIPKYATPHRQPTVASANKEAPRQAAYSSWWGRAAPEPQPEPAPAAAATDMEERDKRREQARQDEMDKIMEQNKTSSSYGNPSSVQGPAVVTSFVRHLIVTEPATEHILLRHKGIDAPAAVALARVFSSSTPEALCVVDFGFNQICTGVPALATALCAIKTLHTINLAGNQLRDSGAAAVARAVQSGAARLRSLDLSSNSIGDLGATSLKGLLEGHHTLQKLNLNRNTIGNDGAWQLMMGILLTSDCRLLLSNNAVDIECQSEIKRQEAGNRMFL